MASRPRSPRELFSSFSRSMKGMTGDNYATSNPGFGGQKQTVGTPRKVNSPRGTLTDWNKKRYEEMLRSFTVVDAASFMPSPELQGPMSQAIQPVSFTTPGNEELDIEMPMESFMTDEATEPVEPELAQEMEPPRYVMAGGLNDHEPIEKRSPAEFFGGDSESTPVYDFVLDTPPVTAGMGSSEESLSQPEMKEHEWWGYSSDEEFRAARSRSSELSENQGFSFAFDPADSVETIAQPDFSGPSYAVAGPEEPVEYSMDDGLPDADGGIGDIPYSQVEGEGDFVLDFEPIVKPSAPGAQVTQTLPGGVKVSGTPNVNNFDQGKMGGEEFATSNESNDQAGGAIDETTDAFIMFMRDLLETLELTTTHIGDLQVRLNDIEAHLDRGC